MDSKSNCKYCGQVIYWRQEYKWTAYSDKEFNQLHKPSCNNFGAKHRFNEGDVLLFTRPASHTRKEWEKEKELIKIKQIIDQFETCKYEVIQYGKYGWWDKSVSNGKSNKIWPCNWIDKNSIKLDESVAIALYG